jgi:hypothetical protein
MTTRRVEEKIRDVLNENKNDLKQLKEFLPIWRENFQRASEELEKGTLQMAFTLFLFAMIDAAQLSNVQLFGLNFRTIGIPMLVLFIITVLLYYRCMAMICFYALIEDAMHFAYFKIFSAYEATGLCGLLMYPSILQIENITNNLREEEDTLIDRFSDFWSIFLATVLIIFPLIGLIWASYELIHNPAINQIVSGVAVLFFAIVSLRALAMIFHDYARWL